MTRPTTWLSLAITAAISAATLLPAPVCAQQIAIAVAPFSDASGRPDSDALGKGLADMLITDLSAATEFKLVERERLAELIAEMKLAKRGLVDKKTAQKLGKLVGAELLVMGTMTAVAPNLRLDARLVAVESGEIMAAAQATGLLTNFFAVESQLASALLKKFGVALTPLLRMKVGRSPTRNLAAIRAYSRGLDATDSGDKAGARKAFSEALAADPAFAQAQARLKAVEQRVAKLEQRTAAVERAGGLILRPKSAIEFWSNAKVHLGRGATSAAELAMNEALKLQPAAIDVMVARQRHKGAAPATVWPAAVPDVVRAAAQAIGQGRGEIARQTTQILSAKQLKPPWDAAARWLRLTALQAPLNDQPTARERAEQSALVHDTTLAASAAAVLLDPDERAARIAQLADRRRHYDQRVYHQAGPTFAVRRTTLLDPPVHVSLGAFGGRWKPPFMLKVRVAEPGASACTVRVADGELLKLQFAKAQPFAQDATLFEVTAPYKIPVGEQRVEVAYTNRRGEAETWRAKTLLSLTWRNPGSRAHSTFGEVFVNKYANLHTEFAPWRDADKGGALLVDPVAGVWTIPIAGHERFEIPVLDGGLPTAFSIGALCTRSHPKTGTVFRGIERTLIFGQKSAPVLVGKGRYGVREQRAERRWISAAQSTAGEGGIPLFDTLRVAAPDLAATTRFAEREVSVDDYNTCVAAGACQPLLGVSCAAQQGRYAPYDFDGRQATGCLQVTPNPYPVTGVLKRQAEAYCKWRGGKLPAFADWQRLARASAPAAREHDNFLDAVTCDWTRYGRKPRSCDPGALTQTNAWDGHGWVAPAGYGSDHLLGNVREWLADKGHWAAGCTWNDELGPPCKARSEVTSPLDSAVGFRCIGPGPLPDAPAKAHRPKTTRPSLDWQRIPGGDLAYGGALDPQTGKPGPRAVLQLPAATADKRAAVHAELVGVTKPEFSAFIDALVDAGVVAELDSHHVQELFSRARSAGLSKPAIQMRNMILEMLRGTAKDDSLRPVFDIYINVKYTLAAWQRKQAGTPPQPAERATALFAKIIDTVRHYHRTARRDDGPRWYDDHGYSCADLPFGGCTDVTGARGTRLMVEQHSARTVRISPFQLMTGEVTQREFSAAMGYVPSLTLCPDCPVERVTWTEAVTFCERVGGRLPTEAEWQWAALGGGTKPMYGQLDAIARWRGNTTSLQPARGKDDNGYDLHDMIGGVWEWTADHHRDADDFERTLRYIKLTAENEPRRYRGDSVFDVLNGKKPGPTGRVCLYASGTNRLIDARLARLPWRREKPKQNDWLLCVADVATALKTVKDAVFVDPQGPQPKDDSRRPPKRVLRGGSWGSDERLLNAATRIGYQADMRHDFVGFRCAR